MVVGKNVINPMLKVFRLLPNDFTFKTKVNKLNVAMTTSIAKIADATKKDGCQVIHLAYSGGVVSNILLRKFAVLGHNVICHTIGGFGVADPDIIFAKRGLLKFNGDNVLRHEAYMADLNSEKSKKECSLLLNSRTCIAHPYYDFLHEIVTKNAVSHLVIGEFANQLFAGSTYHSESNEGTYENIIRNTVLNCINEIDVIASYYGVKIWLPMISPSIISEVRQFKLDELIRNKCGKLPLKAIAKFLEIPFENENKDFNIISLMPED